jgi:hypothetical protein
MAFGHFCLPSLSSYQVHCLAQLGERTPPAKAFLDTHPQEKVSILLRTDPGWYVFTASGGETEVHKQIQPFHV